jgi:hypothetical protein
MLTHHNAQGYCQALLGVKVAEVRPERRQRARLEKAEQHAQRKELGDVPHAGHGGSAGAPADQQARKPQVLAVDVGHDDLAAGVQR